MQRASRWEFMLSWKCYQKFPANMAMKDLLIRNVPDSIVSWIEAERERSRLSQQEFLLSLIQQAQSDHVYPWLPFLEREVPRSYGEGIPFRFIDLFAGIGGFRIALEKLGGTCVFTCEWDKYAQKTYRAWFGEIPHGDIRKLDIASIPDHDILVAGFPCQPFSIAGVSKKASLGMPHGFRDQTQGNLFFHLATIVEIKRPPVLLLENVKNLQSHDGGNTWRVIKKTLEKLEYEVYSEILDAKHWVPQHRERIFIVCFDKRVFGEKPPFQFPEPPADGPKLNTILETKVDRRYTLSDHLWNYLQDYAERHKLKGNGFGYGLADPNSCTRTLSARYYKDGSEILIAQRSRNPRRLTPREAAKLMGFDPDHYQIVVSDTQAYRQFGNAVVPLVAEAVGRSITRTIAWHLTKDNRGCLLKASGAQSKGVVYG